MKTPQNVALQTINNEEGGFLEIRSDDQTIDIKVYDVGKYLSYPKDHLEFQWIQSELFTYWCFKCHQKKNEFDGISLIDYKESWSKYLLVENSNHGDWDEEIANNLDVFDIEAIRMFIQKSSR